MKKLLSNKTFLIVVLIIEIILAIVAILASIGLCSFLLNPELKAYSGAFGSPYTELNSFFYQALISLIINCFFYSIAILVTALKLKSLKTVK